MIASLPHGITHIALHSAVPGDIDAISPQHAPWRTQEYALLTDGTIKATCDEE